MFQLWKLVFLCGLLTGTSASLSEDLENDLSDVEDKLQPVVDKGLETVESVLQKLKAELESLQESESWQEAKQKVQEAENLLGKVLSKISQITGLKISNLHILDAKVELTDDGKGISLILPITANVSLTLPLLGQVDLDLTLDLLTTVTIETDAETGVSLTLGECASDPASISLTLLDRRRPLVNRAVNSVVKVLRNVVSLLVQKEVCPLIQKLIENLGASFFKNIIDSLPKA
ncbi:BPI fold-containing family A member 2 [Phacochoerus africanus]|uniref:BPI fold-containing family A member 2 n=1 Tax=Phacochoerus africanus TaxID=41426 RepID=UPI001FDAA855|nr:BPI fold-containing family A member 2 [Phacochoerus africanus]